MLTDNESKDPTSPLLTMDFTGGYAKYNEVSYSPSLPAGYLLHEFKILSILGTGGFGITYLANDTNLNLQVAIKEYFPPSLAVRDMATGSVFVKYEKFNSHEADFEWGKTRFAQEAQTLARFHHPNIVHVLRYFEANGTGYMVMAYEDGQSLEELLNSDKIGWAEENILEFFKPLLDGVAHVHQAGFLHRDIKPSNIYVRKKDWSPVLLDFGSARAALTNHTQTLTALVSPGYCPLEQYFDEGTQGAWSDIYSIGGVIYRIVTGASPPLAPSRVKKDSMVPMVFAGHQKYSPAFLSAVDQALCMDEEKRPQSIAEWLPGLEGQAQKPEPVTVNDSNIPDAAKAAKNSKQIPLLESTAANPVQINAKRTFYDILQVSNDADIDVITASYQRLKSECEGAGESAARNEMIFIKHAFEVLSNTNRRKTYDNQIAKTPITDDAIMSFVSENYEYFARKWQIAAQKKSKLSWNWAAFILGPGWMAYRKMYLYPSIFLGVVFVDMSIQHSFHVPTMLSIGITIGASIMFGLLGNYWYKLHVEKNVKQITTTYDAGEAEMELSRQGGTSIASAIYFEILFYGLIAAFALTGYTSKLQQDYIAQARFSRIQSVASLLKTAVGVFASENDGLTKLTPNSAANLNAMGYAGSPPLPPEASGIFVGEAGVITVVVAPGVIGSTSCGNVTYTPSFDSRTGVRWAVATTCPEPVPTIVAGWY